MQTSTHPLNLFGSLLALILGLGATLQVQAQQAPSGNKVSAAIPYYSRVTPFVAASGRYKASSIAEIRALGFRTVVELRGPGEPGVVANAVAAREAGLNYIGIPITSAVPTDEQVRAFARIVENPANYPVLASCVSANRVGAMWALYRAQSGVAAEIAVEEGRTAGLTGRESQVRVRLGLGLVAK